MTRSRFTIAALAMGTVGILLSACSGTSATGDTATPAASGSRIQPSITVDAKVAALLPK